MTSESIDAKNPPVPVGGEEETLRNLLDRHSDHDERCRRYQQNWKIRFHGSDLKPTCLCGYEVRRRNAEACVAGLATQISYWREQAYRSTDLLSSVERHYAALEERVVILREALRKIRSLNYDDFHTPFRYEQEVRALAHTALTEFDQAAKDEAGA